MGADNYAFQLGRTPGCLDVACGCNPQGYTGGAAVTARTTSALGFLAVALLFLGMFAGLFGAYGSTAPERQCWNCGRVGGLVGVTLPPLRSKLSNHAPLI